MARYQIIYWRDIPAQVKVRVGRERSAKPLSQRFQIAIDEAAMRAGLIGSSAYLDEWRNGEWHESNEEPQTLVDQLVQELEDEFPTARLRDMITKNGWDHSKE